MPGTVLGARGAAVSKTDVHPSPEAACILMDKGKFISGLKKSVF